MKKHEAINTLATFCGPRDLDQLTQQALKKKIGQSQVDVCVFFGGSILAGAGKFTRAIRNKIPQYYIIVGGYGHTTQSLINRLPADFTGQTSSEAELFADYLAQYEVVTADYLETQSTNCANNITYLLDLVNQDILDPQRKYQCHVHSKQISKQKILSHNQKLST